MLWLAQDPSNKLKPGLYRHKVEAALKGHVPLSCCTHCQFVYTAETMYVAGLAGTDSEWELHLCARVRSPRLVLRTQLFRLCAGGSLAATWCPATRRWAKWTSTAG